MSTIARTQCLSVSLQQNAATSTTAVAQTNIGNCCDVVAGAGSTLTGQSGFELSDTMAAGIATCKIIALYDAPDNAFGANAIMEVTVNEHLLGTRCRWHLRRI